jgi:hypothetical protein
MGCLYDSDSQCLNQLLSVLRRYAEIGTTVSDDDIDPDILAYGVNVNALVLLYTFDLD